MLFAASTLRGLVNKRFSPLRECQSRCFSGESLLCALEWPLGGEWVLVGSAVFKTVVGREERPGCVRFARASAIALYLRESADAGSRCVLDAASGVVEGSEAAAVEAPRRVSASECCSLFRLRCSPIRPRGEYRRKYARGWLVMTANMRYVALLIAITAAIVFAVASIAVADTDGTGRAIGYWDAYEAAQGR